MRGAFDWIFAVFKLSLIYPLHIGPKDKATWKCLNLLLLIFNIYVSVLIVSFAVKPLDTGMPVLLKLSSVLIVTLATLYRWLLCFKLSRLKEISKELDSNNCKPTTWIHRWTLASIAIYAVMAVHFTRVMYLMRAVQPFGFKIGEPYNCIIKFLFSFHFIISLLLPLNTFPIFYSQVCLHIKSELSHFSKFIFSQRNTDYDTLLQMYLDITHKVERIDDKLSFFVFLSAIFNSVMVYHFIPALNYAHANGPEKTVLMSCIVCCSFLSFVVMIISASLVSEESELVAKRARGLTGSSLTSRMALQGFNSVVGKGAHLTVWNMVAIKRSFTIGLIGTIFTYVMLFYGIKS